ncbi:hypothetical protein GUJ93_ZPchr0458g22676 [Zizania palustris]|uniref:Uncharacterized protein n=1 Tax=Zizania palustris TaxID=103762 RepID=A0A8J5VDR3_ZIZPA|nr:hypothetical protein GUJ93_ZPchr0458g22676 [Zizania palustris]
MLNLLVGSSAAASISASFRASATRSSISPALRVSLLLERVTQHEQPELHLPLPVVLQDLLVRLPHPAEFGGAAVEAGDRRLQGVPAVEGQGLMKNLFVCTCPLVPDARAVCRPMPLYMAAAASGRGGCWFGGGTLVRCLDRWRGAVLVAFGTTGMRGQDAEETDLYVRDSSSIHVRITSGSYVTGPYGRSAHAAAVLAPAVAVAVAGCASGISFGDDVRNASPQQISNHSSFCSVTGNLVLRAALLPQADASSSWPLPPAPDRSSNLRRRTPTFLGNRARGGSREERRRGRKS